MPQFLVLARDGSDPEAPARRMAAREAHLDRVRPFVDEGKIVIGGATLDDDGGMTGSALIADFPSRAEVDAWIAADPYTTGGVWRSVEVYAFRVAVAGGLKA